MRRFDNAAILTSKYVTGVVACELAGFHRLSKNPGLFSAGCSISGLGFPARRATQDVGISLVCRLPTRTALPQKAGVFDERPAHFAGFC